jgi:hypothetical protein
MGWTDERIAMLRKLWLDGLSAGQIAKQLGGVTRNAVIGKVHRLGLVSTGRRDLSSRSRGLHCLRARKHQRQQRLPHLTSSLIG